MTMKKAMEIQAFLFLALLLQGCNPSSGSEEKGFTFRESSQGIELSEDGKAVFFYQKEPRSGDGASYFNNYLHPVYSLNGDTLTEEFPEDHLHHRGIFWAWHQIYVGEQSMGDGWNDVNRERMTGGGRGQVTSMRVVEARKQGGADRAGA